MHELDDIDRELLELLRRNARSSVATLAKAVHRSRTAVQSRIDRLERDGYIGGYTLIAGSIANAAAVEAMVSLTFDQRPCQQVIARFIDWPQVERVHSLAGDVDALVHVRVSRSDDLSSLVDRLAAVHGVSSARSSVVLQTTAARRVI